MNYIKLKITDEIERLQSKLKELERNERKSNRKIIGERQLRDIQEYERRLSIGENVAPLKKYIDLEDLVGTDIFESVMKNEQEIESHFFQIRGCNINFYTPNLRSLWQSAGQEYIEPELLDFIDSIPNDGVYFDIGASTGVFALYAAFKGVKTLCFEPDFSNFYILNMNSFLNHSKIGSNFSTFNIALSNEKALNNMYVRKVGGAAHEKILGKCDARDGTTGFSAEYIQSIVTLSLDEFCGFSNIIPTDIKIDVDGAESDLVEGMSKTLDNPILSRIFIEISEHDENSLLALNKILDTGFTVQKKTRVQNYFSEYNYILIRG